MEVIFINITIFNGRFPIYKTKIVLNEKMLEEELKIIHKALKKDRYEVRINKEIVNIKKLQYYAGLI